MILGAAERAGACLFLQPSPPRCGDLLQDLLQTFFWVMNFPGRAATEV